MSGCLICPTTSLVRRALGLCGSGLALALMAGCASPGQPRPPSLHLPERVTSLTALREGGAVKIHFTAPARTTDGEGLSAPGKASLCRAVGDGPCHATQSFPGKVAVSGAVEWVDVLPTELAHGAARRLVYRVEVFNAAGRSAGPSDPVDAAAGEAPRSVEGFKVEGSHAGVVLRWAPGGPDGAEVLVERESLNAPAAEKKTVATKGAGVRKGRRAPSTTGSAGTATDAASVWLHATASVDSSGMVDASAVADEPYRYTAIRSRFVSVDGLKLEVRSEVSAAVSFTLRDVFPPGVPQGLTVAGFPVEGKESLSVDLVWQPDTESDLVGYNVYRQTIPQGAAVKLNAKPVTLPSFRDESAARGMAYRYSVTAVDSKGNESAASRPAELAATP